MGPHGAYPPGAARSSPQAVDGQSSAQASGGIGVSGCMGSHAGQCSPSTGNPALPALCTPGLPACPEAPAGDPPGGAEGKRAPMGHFFRSPHPRTDTPQHAAQTPAASALPDVQQPGHPVRQTARRAPPAVRMRPHLIPQDALGGHALCRCHSVQSQFAGVRAVGLMTGPHTHTPRIHSQWVAGPVYAPRKRAVGRGRAPTPGRPTSRQGATFPGRPLAAPTARKASSQERALWDW